MSKITTSALFTEILDSEAQIVQGGQQANYFKIKINECGIRICYGFDFPGLQTSGSFKYSFYNPKET